MRISQAYVSKSVMDFPFHQVYRLSDYNSTGKSSVFFGMYRFEDACMLYEHRDRSITFWTGQDVLQWDTEEAIFNFKNVTAHPKIKSYLSSYGRDCTLVKPAAFLNTVKPQVLGKKIYAYCPSSAPDYHGKKIIDELSCRGYEITVGGGQFTQDEWRNGQADFHYKDCYIGLCLSEFAGGGGSIIEMGLRGMKVVTNVFDLPNCIPWNSLEDVVTAIEQETKSIGRKNRALATYVWNDLDHQYKWLEI